MIDDKKIWYSFFLNTENGRFILKIHTETWLTKANGLVITKLGSLQAINLFNRKSIPYQNAFKLIFTKFIVRLHNKASRFFWNFLLIPIIRIFTIGFSFPFLEFLTISIYQKSIFFKLYVYISSMKLTSKLESVR